jgi:hypothetical protein
VEDGAGKFNAEFAAVDSQISEGFQTLQQLASDLMISVTRQLAQGIASESDARVRVLAKLESQAGEVNARVGEALTQLQTYVAEMSRVFSELTTKLVTAIGQNLRNASEYVNEIAEKVNSEIDPMIVECCDKFSIFQSEIVALIMTSSAFLTKSRDLLSEALGAEWNIRERNDKEIHAKFIHFERLINQELELQLRHLDDDGRRMEAEGIFEVDRAMRPSQTELIIIRQQERAINAAERIAAEVEGQIRQTQTQFQASAGVLTADLVGLSQNFHEFQRATEVGLTEFEARLDAFGDGGKSGLATHKVLHGTAAQADQIADQRMQEVEGQLAVVMANVAQLAAASRQLPRRTGTPLRDLGHLVAMNGDDSIGEADSDDGPADADGDASDNGTGGGDDPKNAADDEPTNPDDGQRSNAGEDGPTNAGDEPTNGNEGDPKNTADDEPANPDDGQRSNADEDDRTNPHDGGS